MYGRHSQAVYGNFVKLRLIIGDTAARTAKGKSGTHYYGIAYLVICKVHRVFQSFHNL